MITRLNKIVFILAAFTALTVTSCKKDKFDEPPHTTADPNIANASIKQLRALFSTGNPITITNDIIIGGVVTADDRSGNFYKQFVLQDDSGAIPVLVNKSGLYTDYPIGRKVYIKCKGLVLGQYGKNLQLGGYIDYTGAQPSVGNIASALVDNYIVKGPMVTPIAPRVIHSFAELNMNTDQSLLVKFDPVSFDPAAAGLPYADVVNGVSLSRSILDCDGSRVDVRTSNYSNFANSLTPASTDKVSIIGVYSIYNSSKQLTIRATEEIVPTTTPCPTVLFYENFSGGSVPGTWQNYKEAGSKNWYTTTFSGNTLAKCSAYGSSDASNIAWLITPVIDLATYTSKMLTFNLTIGQIAGTTSIDVLISTNYSGSGDPTLATWAPLPYTPPALPSGGSFGTPTNSVIDLHSYSGPVYVAFKYTGSGANGNTTTYEVDDVKVTAQ